MRTRRGSRYTAPCKHLQIPANTYQHLQTLTRHPPVSMRLQGAGGRWAAIAPVPWVPEVP